MTSTDGGDGRKVSSHRPGQVLGRSEAASEQESPAAVAANRVGTDIHEALIEFVLVFPRSILQSELVAAGPCPC